MKIPVDRYNAALLAYYQTDRQLRVGQYLMNELIPAVKDSELFYMVNHKLAIELFTVKYVEGYDA